jgi:hypothetical protein
MGAIGRDVCGGCEGLFSIAKHEKMTKKNWVKRRYDRYVSGEGRTIASTGLRDSRTWRRVKSESSSLL